MGEAQGLSGSLSLQTGQLPAESGGYFGESCCSDRFDNTQTFQPLITVEPLYKDTPKLKLHTCTYCMYIHMYPSKKDTFSHPNYICISTSEMYLTKMVWPIGVR